MCSNEARKSFEVVLSIRHVQLRTWLFCNNDKILRLYFHYGLACCLDNVLDARCYLETLPPPHHFTAIPPFGTVLVKT